jgi:SAM-dependent methyltransferase
MKKQSSSKQKNDIFGMALNSFYFDKDEAGIVVHSPDFDDDIIPVHYLFREYEEMPLLEKTALDNSRGRVLDVGCGAGSHALYLQIKKKLDVTAIDISPGAIEIAKIRGLVDARNINYFDLKEEKFDTIILLMNGTGIIQKLDNLDNFFEHSKTLLNPGGKILIDSSDLRYLFDEDEDGGIWVDMDSPYYGELEFTLSYKDRLSAPFNWLYLDFNMLDLAAAKMNFKCELLREGEHFDYLASLQLE